MPGSLWSIPSKTDNIVFDTICLQSSKTGKEPFHSFKYKNNTVENFASIAEPKLYLKH